MSVVTSTGVLALLFQPMFVGCDEPTVATKLPAESLRDNSTYTSTSSPDDGFVNHKLNLCTPPGITLKPNCSQSQLRVVFDAADRTGSAID